MKEENSTKQRTDLEQILALALIKNLYNQGKISEYVYRKIRSDTETKIALESKCLVSGWILSTPFLLYNCS